MSNPIYRISKNVDGVLFSRKIAKETPPSVALENFTQKRKTVTLQNIFQCSKFYVKVQTVTMLWCIKRFVRFIRIYMHF